MQSEIGLIVSFYFRTFKRSYSNFLGKGVMGKRLAQLLSETDEINPDNLIPAENLGVRKKDGTADVPPTYEEWIKNEREKESSKSSEKLGEFVACYPAS